MPEFLGGRYELGDCVGRGGMTVVFQAIDNALKRLERCSEILCTAKKVEQQLRDPPRPGGRPLRPEAN
jgi:hypothetical protein